MYVCAEVGACIDTLYSTVYVPTYACADVGARYLRIMSKCSGGCMVPIKCVSTDVGVLHIPTGDAFCNLNDLFTGAAFTG